jgi:peptide/nickel transport system permease protein
MIPMMFAVIVMVFLIMAFTPGDPATNVLPLNTPAEIKAQFNARVGFSDNLWERFGNYMKGLLSGNVISYTTEENIFGELFLRIPVTFKVGIQAFVIAMIIGVSLGILSAIKQYSFLDTTVTIFAITFASVPSFFVAMMLVLLFAVNLGWLPTFGLEDGWLSYVMPVTTMVLGTIPMLSRLTRSSMLDAMNQDFIRTARAKGCSEKRVIWKHALKNALIPIITIVGSQFSILLGGTTVIETVFSWPGVGMYTVSCIRGNDFMSATCNIVMVSILTAVILLAVDMLYAFVDPRIKARYKRG